jgi:hypothetical protein
MILVLTYDQLSESEASDTFISVSDLMCFAFDQLYGEYSVDMNWFQFTYELEKNGYFVEVRD